MKSRIALEAIKGQKTIQEIASHYGVHPNQVTNWKRQAVEGMSSLFADRRSRPDTSEETVRAELYCVFRPIPYSDSDRKQTLNSTEARQ
jgi:transposase-like protein